MFDPLSPGLLRPVPPDALTEPLRTTVPLHLRNAVADAAQRSGNSVAGFIRETLAERVAREASPATPHVGGPRGRPIGD